MTRPISRTRLCAVIVLLSLPAHAAAQGYRVDRIASGLDQPTFITQAPGDPANILYFTERTTNPVGGFDVNNAMGKVWRYDVNTRAKTVVLDLSARGVRQDTGLSGIAFHPDFNVPASPGFGKMYVSSAERGTSPINRIEEYTVPASGPAAFSRTILQYNNTGTVNNNHTVNWLGFDPAATGPARGYLHVSTGDGTYGLANRPSQNPADLQGKILRLDVTPGAPDAYPGDGNKNFAIPGSNPLPAYNAAHPGTPIAGLGEVYVTGVRNASRVSFDRANGDLYVADVGENKAEELNFIQAGSNTGITPPVDLGWPRREGTQDGLSSPFTKTNPFTGVTSLEPIRTYPNPSPGAVAIIGGYRYRGPVAALQDKYFFADFVGGNISMLDFDRDSAPAGFNGANGTLTDLTALWNSLVIDPSDPSYTPAVGAVHGIDHVVSFGEDNAGNLYIVDFGPGTGFAGQYPAAGLGEIFRITIPEPASLGLLAMPALLLARRPRTTRRRSRRTGR